MKLLFLLQALPYPPNTGINRKAYNVISYLAAKGWECDILCFGNPEAAAGAAELEKRAPGVKVLSVIPTPRGAELLVKKILSFLKGLPPSLGEFSSAGFRAALEKAGQAKKYDAVHYDVINMAQYLPWGPRVPSVLSSNDAISLSYERMIAENRGRLRKAYLHLAAFLIKRFEREVYPRFSKVHVVSGEDAAHLRGVCPEMDLEVIPIAVDRSFTDLEPARPGAGRGAARGVFTGNLDIPGIANGLFDFLDGSYRDLAASFPFEFSVLGPKASAEDEKRVSAFPGLKYFRWVEDYRAFLASADILLALDRSGTGIKTRVLEAMALGKPVIGSKIAFGGINAEHGRHCFICSGHRETAAALKQLLADPALREKVGREARGLVLSGYSMAVVGPKWAALYSGLRPRSE